MQENSGRYDKKAGVMPEVIRYLKIEEKQVKKKPRIKGGANSFTTAGQLLV